MFGGTFDPIHIAHLRTALEAGERFDLDKIVFIPAASPPHKRSGAKASSADRLSMITSAITPHPRFAVSDVEMKRKGPSYTIDTLDEFKKQLPREILIHLIMGEDAFFDLHTWKSYTDVLHKVPVIVMTRPDKQRREPSDILNRMTEYLFKITGNQYQTDSSRKRLYHPGKPSVFFAKVTPFPISSTRIRRLIRKKRSAAFLVPHRVHAYIQEKGLYL